MLTGGTKTVYSWDTDKGEITQKTETVKNYSEALKNPLINLNEEIQRLEGLVKSLSEKLRFVLFCRLLRR
jgi:hypothetical protein